MRAKMKTSKPRKMHVAIWSARLAFVFFFFWNIQCALSFLMHPADQAFAFGLAGLAGEAAIRGIAIAFLMWNVTYPLVILDPIKYRTVSYLVIVQQAVGLIGECWILATVRQSEVLLSSQITRFIYFDAAGLLIMSLALIGLMLAQRNSCADSADIHD